MRGPDETAVDYLKRRIQRAYDGERFRWTFEDARAVDELIRQTQERELGFLVDVFKSIERVHAFKEEGS